MYLIFYLLDKAQNSTIEERVSLLELQVVDLDEDVDFLFDEQVIQDERLLGLEQTTDAINAELVSVDDEIEGEELCATTFHCHFSETSENYFKMYFTVTIKVYLIQPWTWIQELLFW